MKTVLNVMASDDSTNIGFKEAPHGRDNINYILYLPGRGIDSNFSFETLKGMFSGRVADEVYDYVTIHDGDYDESSKWAMRNFLMWLDFSLEARINKPIAIRID